MAIAHPIPTLPHATAWTDLLLSPAPPSAPLDPALRRALGARVAAGAPGRHEGPIRLDGYRIEQIRAGRANEVRPAFVWTPSASRRLIGVAAARRVLGGFASSPTEAVIDEIDEIVSRSARHPARPGSLSMWLAESPRGVRASAVAHAIGYATDLLISVDFDRLGPRAAVGGPDPIWAAPGAPWVSLRGRRDAEVLLDEGGAGRALLCVRAGRPTPRAESDLGLVALAAALVSPDRPVPARVMGIWPAAGRAVSLEVTRTTIQQAARQVVEATVAMRRASSQLIAA